MKFLQTALFYLIPVIVGILCIQRFKLKYPDNRFKPYLITVAILIPVMALDYWLWSWLGPIVFGA